MKRKSHDARPNLMHSLEHAKCVPMHPYLKEYVGYTLLKVALRIRAAVDAGLAEFGIIGPQFGMLVILREMGPLTQSELGAQMAIDKATMVRFIDALEERKYLTRATSASDRRAKFLQLTPSGRQALNRMDEVRRRAENEVLSPLSAAEREQLRRIAHKMINATAKASTK